MDEITHRLRNWGRVVRDLGPRQGRVGSLESNWRSPQVWDEPVHATNLPLTGPDIADGWRVEAAWATLKKIDRAVLRSHYCWRSHYAAAALRASRRMTTARYSGSLEVAQAAIAAALLRPEDQNHNIVRVWVKKTLAIVSDKEYNEFTAQSA